MGTGSLGAPESIPITIPPPSRPSASCISLEVFAEPSPHSPEWTCPLYTHRVSVSGLSEPHTSVRNTFSYKQQKNMMSSALNTRGLFSTCHKKARGGQLLHKKNADSPGSGS